MPPSCSPPATLFANSQQWPYKKQLRFASTATNVADSGPFLAAVRELWPRGAYRMQRGAGKGYYSDIHTESGFDVDVLTYNQTPR